MAVDWMQHPLNTRSSSNVTKMMMKQGYAGYGAFWAINEALMQEPTHSLETDYNVLGYRLHADAGLIKSVATEFGLYVFTDDGEYMHSELVDDWASHIEKSSAKKSEAGKRGASKRWQADGTAIAKPKQSHSTSMAKDSTLHDTTLQDNTKPTPPKPPKGGQGGMSREQEFATEIWPKHPKPNGNFLEAQKAYVQATAAGEVTKEQVLAKIDEYKAYLALNHKQSGYTVSGGNWFANKQWLNTWDTKTPEKRPETKSGRPVKQEVLPDWAQPGYKAPEGEVDPEVTKKLAEFRAQFEKLGKEGAK